MNTSDIWNYVGPNMFLLGQNIGLIINWGRSSNHPPLWSLRFVETLNLKNEKKCSNKGETFIQPKYLQWTVSLMETGLCMPFCPSTLSGTKFDWIHVKILLRTGYKCKCVCQDVMHATSFYSFALFAELVLPICDHNFSIHGWGQGELYFPLYW